MKYSIRDLLLVTVIVALALGWWLDHRRWLPTDRTQSEVEELERRNELLESSIYEIDRQLAEHKLQLEQKFYWGMGGRKTSHIEVIPLDPVERERRDNLPSSSTPDPIPPQE